MSTVNTRSLGDKLTVAAMRLLKEAEGGSLPASDLVKKIEKDIKNLIPNLPDWAYDTYSDGNPKWLASFRFQSIELVKAGFIRKEKRVWYLEDKGRDMLKEKSEKEIVSIAHKEYVKWAQRGKPLDKSKDKKFDSFDSKMESIIDDKNYFEQAKNGIIDFINRIDAYEFQNLCAALLRGMGYYVPEFKKGADGGIDMVAYRDPLGAQTPRLKVQVKHEKINVAPKDVRELHGLLTEGEVGVFICNSEFTPTSRAFARTAHKHLRLIRQDDFIKLWCEFYPKMSEKDQSLLPLMEISFLDEKRIIEE